MPPIPLADNFLAGSLLTLLMPTGLLIAIAIWYVLAVKRVPKDTPTSSPSLPSPDVLAAAPPPTSEATPSTSEATPPERPAGQS
jgi:hypothetical protein